MLQNLGFAPGLQRRGAGDNAGWNATDPDKSKRHKENRKLAKIENQKSYKKKTRVPPPHWGKERGEVHTEGVDEGPQLEWPGTRGALLGEEQPQPEARHQGGAAEMTQDCGRGVTELEESAVTCVGITFSVKASSRGMIGTE